MYEPGGALRVKVRKKLRHWWSAGASLEVLRWITKGVRIEWKDGKVPAPFHQGQSFASVSLEERKFVVGETERLLKSGAIRKHSRERPDISQKHFSCPKATSSDLDSVQEGSFDVTSPARVYSDGKTGCGVPSAPPPT